MNSLLHRTHCPALAATLVVLLCTTGCAEASPAPAAGASTVNKAASERPLSFGDSVQGITISTHRSGQDWANEATMRPTMERLKALGAEWVAIHPYAAIRDDGRVETFRHSQEHVTQPIKLAHELGLKILIKPHLAYWGSKFSWRGEITFESEAEWNRFWNGYHRWITELASVSAAADGFVIGTELDKTLDHLDRWHALIDSVRDASPAPITYAANWPDFERVPFWGKLDAIGIQSYFPVAEKPGLDPEAFRLGWSKLRKRLEDYSDKLGRPILLTELGYNASSNAAVEPWAYRTGGESADAIQQLLLQIALEEIASSKAIAGAFLWKWFPEPHPVGRNFQLATPELRRVIESAWSEGSHRESQPQLTSQ